MRLSWESCSGTIWTFLIMAVFAVTISGNISAQEEEAAPAAAVDEAAPATDPTAMLLDGQRGEGKDAVNPLTGQG